jgi:TonB family protein
MVILLCVGAVISALSQDRQLPEAAPTEPASPELQPSYPQTEAGFNAQVAAIIAAYRNRNFTAGRQLVEQFRLPHAADWFAEQIGPANSAVLAERYDRMFENFANGLRGTIEDTTRTEGRDLVTHLKNRTKEPPQVVSPDRKLSGIVPVKEPVVLNFEFVAESNRAETDSWMDNFTYQDGAFRLVGHGAYPFWVWADGRDESEPNGGSIVHPATLMARVDPTYPAAAEAKRIEGKVVLHADIDANGFVQNITVVKGDPILAEAAIDAFKQWRYTAATIGDEPIQTDTTVTFTFKRH